MQEQIGLYGIDWDAPLPLDPDDVEAVNVPDIPNPLSEEHFLELQSTFIASADEETDFGKYMNVVRFVEAHTIWVLHATIMYHFIIQLKLHACLHMTML